MTSLTIALLPWIGIFIGAVLTFTFGRRSDRQKQVEALRSQAYADYLRAVAASGHLRSDEDLRDALRDAADAKARLAVYGSAAVIAALARFEETGAKLSSGPSTAAFLFLVSSMRPTTETVASRDLKLVLFGAAHLDAANDRSLLPGPQVSRASSSE